MMMIILNQILMLDDQCETRLKLQTIRTARAIDCVVTCTIMTTSTLN